MSAPKTATTSMATAVASWGEALPDWVADLARECEATSQNNVAGRMGYSSALISQLLRAKYPGNLAAVKEIFEGVFQNSTVECPALGDIPSQDCRAYRAKSRDFQGTSHFRARMYRACGGCARNQKDTAS